MPTGSTLATALTKLKGLLEIPLDAAVTTQDQYLYTLLDKHQNWLADEFDWPAKEDYVDVAVAAGTRYIPWPNFAGFNTEREQWVEVMWTTVWLPTEYGIGPQEYSSLSSGDGGVPIATQDPVQRWRRKGLTQMEIWPIPASNFTLRFWGQTLLTTLIPYGPTQTLDLDDWLVVLYAAAEKAALMGLKSAPAIAEQAKSHFNKIRSTAPTRWNSVSLAQPYKDKRPIKLVPVASAH